MCLLAVKVIDKQIKIGMRFQRVNIPINEFKTSFYLNRVMDPFRSISVPSLPFILAK